MQLHSFTVPRYEILMVGGHDGAGMCRAELPHIVTSQDREVQ